MSLDYNNETNYKEVRLNWYWDIIPKINYHKFRITILQGSICMNRLKQKSLEGFRIFSKLNIFYEMINDWLLSPI